MLLTLLESMVLPLLPSLLSMELMLEQEDMLPTLLVLSMLPSVRLKLNQRLCMVLMVIMVLVMVSVMLPLFIVLSAMLPQSTMLLVMLPLFIML